MKAHGRVRWKQRMVRSEPLVWQPGRVTDHWKAAVPKMSANLICAARSRDCTDQCRPVFHSIQNAEFCFSRVTIWIDHPNAAPIRLTTQLCITEESVL